jgi:hypothetical protein
LISSPSWGSNTITQVSTGTYCISPGADAFWAIPGFTGGDPVVADNAGGSSGCPQDTVSTLFLYDTKTGALVNDSFTVFLAPGP